MIERLQKALARAGVGSRRRVEELIREGRVTVNGEVAALGGQADLEVDAVKVDGKRVQAPRGGHRYLLVNKPPGFVSTKKDPEGRKTVMDLVPPGLRRGLVPVGRLDYSSEGLLLLTDDGDLAQSIAHPSHGGTKTYEVKVKGHPADGEIRKLRDGIVLDGRRTAPARVQRLASVGGRRPTTESTWWTVILQEGRTRQIREMFLRIGHPVRRLRRVAIGALRDPRLPLGRWRELEARELDLLRRRDTSRSARPPRARRQPPRSKRSARTS